MNNLTPAQERRRAVTEAASSGLGIAQPRHVQRLNGRFNLIEDTGDVIQLPTFDPKLGPYVDLIIIDANAKKSRIFYPPGSYDSSGGKGGPPLCYSDNGIGPSVNARVPQGPTCQRCPQAVLGSAIGLKGDKVTACRERKKTAVMVSGHEGAWEFAIPAASLGAWRNYIDWVVKQKHPSGTRQADVSDMITRVFFQQGQANRIDFRSAGFTNPAIDAYIDRVLNEEDTAHMVGADDRPMDAEMFQQHQVAQASGEQLPPPTAPQAPMPVQQGTQFLPEPAPTEARSGGFGPTPAPQQPPAAETAPAPSAEKRRGRKKAEAPPAQQDDMAIPDFLARPQQEAPDRGRPTSAPSAGSGAPTFQRQAGASTASPSSLPQFGVAQGQPPDAGMAAAVAQAFQLPTD